MNGNSQSSQLDRFYTNKKSCKYFCLNNYKTSNLHNWEGYFRLHSIAVVNINILQFREDANREKKEIYIILFVKEA